MTKRIWPQALLTVALRGPSQGLLLASVAGWVAMAWLDTGHRQHSSATALGASPSGHFNAVWLAMILAMAPPLLLREVSRLWRTSLRRLRHLAIAWFLCGYVGVWLLVGLALATLAAWVTAGSARIAVAVAMIALWHCSPARQRRLNACHRPPTLRVFGAAAQWDSWRYGVATGCNCAAACGLVMLLILLVTDHHLAAMAIGAAATTLERYLPARRPGWRLPALSGRSSGWPEVGADMRTPGVGWR